MSDAALQRLLDRDVLGEYQSFGKADALLSLIPFMAHNEQKKEALVKRKDTHYSMSLAEYVEIVLDLGFELVLTTNFVAKGYNEIDPDRNEAQYVYAHREGMVLILDTYTWADKGASVNSSNLYYAHKSFFKDGVEGAVAPRYSSGGYEAPSGWPDDNSFPADAYWYGNHDGREALRHNVTMLRETGQLFPVWPKAARGYHWVWPCHHGDHRDLQDPKPYSEMTKADHAAHREAKNKVMRNAADRLLALPDWVLEMIGKDNILAIGKSEA